MAADPDASVWIVTLPDDDSDLAAARAHLSADELARADRLRASTDRASYIYAHAVLRRLLDVRLGHSLDRAAFDRHPKGKPYLAGRALRFNLSRAQGKCVVGMIENGDIGVDIEPLAADRSNADVASSFSAAERRWVEEAIEEEDRRFRFYRLWVVREAFVKATGEGLSRPLADVALEIEAGNPVLEADSGWRAWEAPPTPGYAAAAVVPRNRTVIWHAATWITLAR
jgi:4'-phosphopantetheinyl transferase